MTTDKTSTETSNTQLSFCKAELEPFRQWVDSLHKVNLGETARQLSLAISELATTNLEPALRLAMLEYLRPVIHYTCQCLAREYSNQPLLLQDRPRQIVELSQYLQDQLAQAFTQVAEEVIGQGKTLSKTSQNRNLTVAGLAIHRAISDLTQTLLRTCRLHTATPTGFWRKIHRLFGLAEQYRLDTLAFTDETDPTTTGSKTIRENYLHTLLLGCVQANRLHQKQITNYYRMLWHWVPLAGLLDITPASEYQFIIDCQSDSSPFRKVANTVTPGNVRYLDITRVVAGISAAPDEQQRQNSSPWGLSLDLVNHLLNFWGVATKRAEKRYPSCKHLLVAIGLYASYYHIAGEVAFGDIIAAANNGDADEEHKNPFLSNFEKKLRQRDIWDKPYEAGRNKYISGQEVKAQIRSHDHDTRSSSSHMALATVEVIDYSPKGYGLLWPASAVPENFDIGEILTIRESETDSWMLANICWIQAGSDQSLRNGIEIIAESATAYGAQLLSNTGVRSKFFRAFVLPDTTGSDPRASILLPAGIARLRNKLLLTRYHEQVVIQLTKETQSNGLYSHFEYQYASRLGELVAKKIHPASKPDFSSVWDQL